MSAMSEWKPYLHWTFNGERVLFSFIVLDSVSGFLLASLLLIAICVAERLVTSCHDERHAPEFSNTRWRNALRRCFLYWVAMVLRLLYMLATMTFNTGLILVIATTLASTQLILDLRSHSRSPSHHFTELVDSESSFVALESVTPTTRPRSRSKPDGIFIHPAESNIARADALAMQLGLSGNPDRVQSNFSDKPQAETVSHKQWELGKGRALARELLKKPIVPRVQQHQRTGSFKIGNESEDDSTDDDDSEVRKLVP